MQYAYDVDGVRLYEADSVALVVHCLVEDLFELDSGTNEGQAHIFAFGQRIASKRIVNVGLQPAGILAFRLPGGPTPWLGGLALLGSLGLMVWLARSGALALIRARPGAAATAGVTAAALVLLPVPKARATGGGSNGPYYQYLFYDHLGSNVLVVNDAGDVVQRRVFEPFGQVFAESQPTEESLRVYTGQRFEGISGLYDFRARRYDPETARFLSVDPIVQGVADPQMHNAYSYVRNNPVNSADPTGEFVAEAGVGGACAIPLLCVVAIVVELRRPCHRVVARW